MMERLPELVSSWNVLSIWKNFCQVIHVHRMPIERIQIYQGLAFKIFKHCLCRVDLSISGCNIVVDFSHIQIQIRFDILEVMQFFVPLLSLLVPVIYLQGYKNADHHKDDFTHGVFEVPARFTFCEKFLADISEEFYHKVNRVKPAIQ